MNPELEAFQVTESQVVLITVVRAALDALGCTALL